MKKTLIVLAAGMGSRFWGLKQVAKVGINWEALLDFTIQDAIQAGFEKVVHVIRKDIESDYRELVVDKYIDTLETHIAYQEIEDGRKKPRGVAQALSVALPYVQGVCAVVNADDYYWVAAMRQMSQLLEECDKTTFGMIWYILSNTLSENGAVNRWVCEVDEHWLLAHICETRGINQSEWGLLDTKGNIISQDAIVSMNFWGFHSNVLSNLSDYVELFKKENLYNLDAELPLPPYVEFLIENWVVCKVVPASDQWIGITYKEDIELAKQALDYRCSVIYSQEEV